MKRITGDFGSANRVQDRAGKLMVTELIMLIEAGNVRAKNPLFWRLHIKKMSR
jgi:hypothetical protein